MDDLNERKRDREERTNRFDGNDEKIHRRFLIENMSSFHYQSSSEDDSEDIVPCMATAVTTAIEKFSVSERRRCLIENMSSFHYQSSSEDESEKFEPCIVSAKENFSSIEQRNDLIESILYLESEKDRIAYIFGKISDADDTSCNEMLSGCTEGSQTIIRKFQDNTPDFRCLLGKHFVRHNPDKFFFDETINCFMLLLSTLDSKLCASDASRIQSYFFSSEFIDNKVVCTNYIHPVKYLQKIIEKKGSLFKMNKLYFPVNIGNNHWILIIVHVRDKVIQCYDSLAKGNDRSEILAAIQNMLREEMIREKICNIEWTISKTDVKKIPQQINGYDCGVFICIYSLFVLLDLDFSFTHRNINYFRKRISLWLIETVLA